ncbi:hypothetical protein OKW41_002092 [Paraburkholderia sp. UCT70]|uniref:hypothetical protein n=1 Tax=Paraburkholderia sp. UCT70 TaxID=2991068 RepID=UPI003D25A4A0
MSSRNAKRRAKFRAPDVLPEAVVVDEWVPDYGRECENCGQTPCVTGVLDGKVVYAGSMCGVCTWGEAACLDPANW